MTALLALLRKQLVESRWMLGISSAALFGFGWLGVFVVAFGQRDFRRRVVARGRGPGPEEMVRRMGGGDGEVTTGTIEVLFWIHPFIWLPIVVWAISRGSMAVAGELERGTLDLTLSRPVRRSTYLLAQALTGTLGLALLVGALLAGNLAGTRFNVIEGPPSFEALLRPASNIAALGFCIFGATLCFSAFDVVRWRPILIASTLTIGSYAAWIVGTTVPALRGTPWETWLYRLSFFTAFNPVDAIGKAAFLARNLAILGGVGAGGLALGLIAFGRRDLPANA